MVEEQIPGPHQWLPFTNEHVLEPFLQAHPHHQRRVDDALDLIAANPYGLALRSFKGHDGPGEAYVYEVPETNVSIIFFLPPDHPGRVGLFQVLDYGDFFEGDQV